MSRRFLQLTYRGQHRGKTCTVPVVAPQRRADEVLLTIESPCWHNFVQPTPVSVRMTERTYRGTAEAINDPYRGRRSAAQCDRQPLSQMTSRE